MSMVATPGSTATLTAIEDDGPLASSDVLVAQAIQLKDPADPVPAGVWWGVSDVLRLGAALSAAPRHLSGELTLRTLDAIEGTLALLGGGPVAAGPPSMPLLRSLRRLARLLFSPDPMPAGLLAAHLSDAVRALAWTPNDNRPRLVPA